MSLRRKTLVIIGTTLLCLIGVLYVFSQIIFLNSFVQLEEQKVRQNVQRALNALQDELSVLHATNRDWAHWTDTYTFVQDLNDHFREGNTHDGIFTSYELNVMLFVNTSGEIVFGKGFNLIQGQAMPVPPSLQDHLSSEGILLDHTDKKGNLNKAGVQGILLLPEGPMLIASSPILTTEQEGPTQGSIIWGRYLDEREISGLAEKTRLVLTLQNLEGQPLATDFQMAKEGLRQEPTTTFIQPLDGQIVAGYTILQDVYETPTLLFRVEVPRDIYAQGQASISYFMLSLLLVGVIFAGATLLLLERVVLSRLAYLNASVSNIRLSNDLSTRITLKGKDELSNLAQAINEMLEALENGRNTLQQARDHALEALRVKAQILANVSHDARTPLSVIKLHAELLQRKLYGPVTEQQHQVLESILASGQQLLFFINNLLDEAQLDASKVHLKHVEFSPAKLLKDIGMSMTPLANRKGLQLVTELGTAVPDKVCGDPERINQILFNLVDNAIKYTDQGTIRVHIGEQDGRHWTLQVSDTGEGIPEAAKERIFEPFWQVDGSTTRKVMSGVGLGLSIVKQLTDLMGGAISVQSQVGAGSTFTVTLPTRP